MSVSGTCQVCSAAPARFRCDACGAVVCEEHYQPGAGLCVDCAGPDAGRRL